MLNSDEHHVRLKRVAKEKANKILAKIFHHTNKRNDEKELEEKGEENTRKKGEVEKEEENEKEKDDPFIKKILKIGNNKREESNKRKKSEVEKENDGREKNDLFGSRLLKLKMSGKENTVGLFSGMNVQEMMKIDIKLKSGGGSSYKRLRFDSG